MPYHAVKFWQKSLVWILKYIGLHDFRPQLGRNCPFGKKRRYYEIFHLGGFYLLIVPYQATNSEKNSYSGS